MENVADQITPQEMAGEDRAKSTTSRAAQPMPIEIDDSLTIAAYTNFCRVTGTPEELIVDFGLNTQGHAPVSMPIKLTQRAVMNFYTAKRLLAALSMAVQRHEQAFGVLETNVQKRVAPQPR